MKHDDRFSMVAGGAAFLATATVFAVSHLGGTVSVDRIPPSDRSGERVAVAEAPRIEVDPAPAPAEETVMHDPAIVAAVNRPTPEPAEDRAQLEAVAVPDVSSEVDELLQLFALSGREVPSIADVLVRRDADGRMVVASGTHRAYASLVDRFEMLEPSRVWVSQSLRGELTRAIDRLLATPEVEVEPEMRSTGVAWIFADPELASLDPDQRRLLLMGRDNAGIVRFKLQELRRELAPEVLTAVATDEPAEPDDRMILSTAR